MNKVRALRNFVSSNILFCLLLVLFLLVSFLISVARYNTYLDGFDYSVFTQTIWHYSRFKLPNSTIRDVNLILGDHFHPLLIILTPLFWLWNNPAVLLGIQPLFFALSAIPIYLLAKSTLGRKSALIISVAYLISHGLQYALYYDFHEIALAVPLISLLIYSIDTKKYRVVIVSALLLCLVKEELILMVAMSGLVLIFKNKKYKLGLSIFLLPLIFLAFLSKILMPALAGKDNYYAYWTYEKYGEDVADVIKNTLRNPFRFLSTAYRDIFTNSTKVETLVVLILSSGITVFGSWYGLLVLPDIALRMLSSRGTFYWSYWFHYGAILMPVIFFCLIDVLRKIKHKLPKKYVNTVPLVLCSFVLAYNIGLMINKNLPFAQIFNSELYSLNKDVRSGEGKVKEIVGNNSSVTAPVVITSHFSNRESIYILTDKGRWYTDENVLRTQEPDTDYVIINEKLSITDVDPYYTYEKLEGDITSIGYDRVYYDNHSGWIVFKR